MIENKDESGIENGLPKIGSVWTITTWGNHNLWEVVLKNNCATTGLKKSGYSSLAVATKCLEGAGYPYGKRGTAGWGFLSEFIQGPYKFVGMKGEILKKIVQPKVDPEDARIEKLLEEARKANNT